MKDRDDNDCHSVQQKLKALSDQFMNPPQPQNLTHEELRHYKDVEETPFEQLLARADELKDESHLILERPVVRDEVTKVVRDLKPNKAAGPDDVHNALLKKIPMRAWTEITKVFNACLREGVYPEVWNAADVVPVPKPGKKLDRPEHYRPIAVSSCMGRVLEKVLADRLQTFCVVRRVFSSNQCGFQPNRRTADVITMLLNDARECLDSNRPCVMIAVDFSKAYDTVWHAGLLRKLATIYGVGGTFLRWVQSFLGGRKMRVKCMGETSAWRRTRCGVPQGSSLSPLLFILYTNDFVVQNPDHVNVGVFADDTALWTKKEYDFRDKTMLQMELEHLARWCRRWRLVINPSKTECCE